MNNNYIRTENTLLSVENYNLKSDRLKVFKLLNLAKIEILQLKPDSLIIGMIEEYLKK